MRHSKSKTRRAKRGARVGQQSGLGALHYEPLENRMMLAGDVSVVLFHGDLFIEGDSDDNKIEITNNGAGGITVTGTDDTLLNGGTEALSYSPDDIHMNMQSGDDAVTVEAIAITGDLTIDGGHGSNTNIVRDSTIGGYVRINNWETYHGTFSDAFQGYVGQYNLVRNNSIRGNLTVSNFHSISSADEFKSAGNYTWIVNNTSIGGNVKVLNGLGEGSTTGVGDNSFGNFTRINRNSLVGGGISVLIDEGSSSTIGESSDSKGNYTKIDDNTTIVGYVTVDIVEGNSSTTGDNSRSDGNNTRIDHNESIGGAITVQIDGGSSSTIGDFSRSFGNYTRVDDNSSAGGNVTINIDGGSSTTTGDRSRSDGSRTGFLRNSITGNVEIQSALGESSTTGQRSDSFGSHAYIGSTTIRGNLKVENNQGESSAAGDGIVSFANSIQMDAAEITGDLRTRNESRIHPRWPSALTGAVNDRVTVHNGSSVGGRTEIIASDDDDLITVIDSVFTDLKLVLNSGDDFAMVMNNTFLGRVGPDLGIDLDGGIGIDLLHTDLEENNRIDFDYFDSIVIV